MEQLRSCVLENVIGISSRFGLGNLNAAAEFVHGSSGNPLFAAFRSTLSMDSVPRPGRNPLQDDVATGVGWQMVLMRSLGLAVGLTLSAPLIRVKLLLQNQGELIRTGRLSTPYLGIKDCFSRTIKNEGVLSLWRGNSVHVFALLPRMVLMHWYGAQINEIAAKSTEVEHQQMHFKEELIAAASLGLNLCIYPLTYAHTRLATDIKCCKGNGERMFNSLLDVYKKTFKSDGIPGIFRGLNIGLSVLLVDQCCRLLLNRQVQSKPSKEKELKILAMAFPAAAVLTMYAVDTVQRRMMMTSGEATKYKSSIDALTQIIKNEGMRSLYKGFGANLLAFIPITLCSLWFRKMNDSIGTISVVIHKDRTRD